MDTSPPGMVTPVVSPRPIQTQKPLSPEDTWKIVGSPPRRPLLSPPEERERNRALDSDLTTVEGNRTRGIAATIATDPVDLTDSTISTISTISSISVGFNESSSSSVSSSSPTSPTAPLHKQAPQRILSSQDQSQEPLSSPIASGAHQPAAFAAGMSLSSFDKNFLLDEPVPQPMHFKSSSTGTMGSKHLDTQTFSVLGHHDVGLSAGLHMKSQSLGSLGQRPTETSSSQSQNDASLESLNLGSLIWNERTTKDINDLTSAVSKNSLVDNMGHTSNTRTGRSLSFSGSGFPNTFGLSTKLVLDQDDEDVLRYRPPLPTMEEETEDTLEPRLTRTRSFSTSAALGSTMFSSSLSGSLFSSAVRQDPFSPSHDGVLGRSEPVAGNESQPLSQRELSSGFSGWPNAIGSDAPLSNHRRSITSTSGYNAPIWESFQPLTTSVERDRQVDRQVDRQRVTRRFSLAPASGFHNYDAFLDDVDAGNSTASGFHRNSTDELVHQAQAHRRHSVAGLGGPYIRPKATPFNLASSLESLQLNDNDQSNSWGLHENLYEEDEYQAPGSNAKELGKGLSLGQLSHCGSLYVVEFKAGRTDLFYVAENSGVSLKVGDLVIVEADRGKDLGKITNDSITPQQIQAMQAQQAEIAALQAQQDGGTNSGGNASGGNAGGGHRAPKEIHPKRIFRLAQPSEVAQLVSKNQDELKAMMICQTKVRQKRLPMEVVDAEYQWDRRKLTFYFIAERRIDFRELVRDLFKIYKTRIWMYAVSPSTVQSNAARLQSSPPQPPQPLHQPGPSGTAILTSPTSPRSHSEYQSAALSGFHLQYSPQHGQYAHYSHYHHVSVPLQHHQQTQQLMPAHLSSSHSFHPLSPLSPLSPPIQQQQQQQQQHHHLHQQLQQQQQNSYPYSSINS